MIKCRDLVPGKDNCLYYIKGGLCMKDTRFRCEEYVRQNEVVLSYSGINSFMKCPRKYYWGSYMGLRVKMERMSDAVKIGSSFDECMTKGVDVLPADRQNVPADVGEAKVCAMVDASRSLVSNDVWRGQGQREIIWEEEGYPRMLCKVDISRGDEFCEIKCSGRPDYYSNPYYIHDQLATYFMADKRYEKCTMLIIRVPGLRLSKNENIMEFYGRCLDDMIARPVYYFNGYDAGSRSFGTVYYRSEFDIDSIKARAKKVGQHIKEAVDEDYWYQDRTQCMLPGQCDYLSVCNTGGISMDIYEYREKVKI
jgi:hypothetical protein